MDAEEVFDLALLKKKKKKKTFDVDTAIDLDENNKKSSGSGKEDGPEMTNSLNDLDDVLDLDLDSDSFGRKKKSRKKKAFNFDEVESSLPVPDEDGINEIPVNADEPEDDDIDLDMDFSVMKKKKKNKKKDLDEKIAKKLIDEKIEDKKQTDGISISWAGSDRDYTYDELLKRVFEIILDKNPEMGTGRKPKFVMRPPQVLRVGTKKTSFANFIDIARTLHRVPKHLLDFLLAELGTSGSMDGNKQLIIKGRFQPKQIENVLRRYIKEYVTCHTCRSPETILQKDTRLFFLQCETCGSRCSVASIKSGFQAVTGKRAAIRAKTT